MQDRGVISGRRGIGGRHWRYLRHGAWLILLQAVLTAAAAYGFSVIQVPVYEATVELFLSARSTRILPRDLEQVRRDHAAFLNSGFRAQAVAAELALDLPPAELLEDVTIRAGTDASTVVITVENSNPELAAAIARAWGQQLVRLRQAENAGLPVEQWIDVEQLDQTTVRLQGPRPLVNAVAGFFFGAAGGAVILVWLEWLAAARLRDREEVEAALGVPLVGRIPLEGEGEFRG